MDKNLKILIREDESGVELKTTLYKNDDKVLDEVIQNIDFPEVFVDLLMKLGYEVEVIWDLNYDDEDF